MQWFPVQTRRFPLGKRRITLGKRALMGSESFFILLSAQTVKYLNMFYIRMMYVISTFLPYFFLFYFKFFWNFKFRRNFLKFTAGMGYRLLPVSVKIGGNRRLPIGKENTDYESALLFLRYSLLEFFLCMDY